MADPNPYIVTDEDGDYQREYASSVASRRDGAWADSVDDAAAMWADEVFPDMENPRTMTAIVTDPNGKQWRVEIEVDYMPTFSTYVEEMP